MHQRCISQFNVDLFVHFYKQIYLSVTSLTFHQASVTTEQQGKKTRQDQGRNAEEQVLWGFSYGYRNDCQEWLLQEC